MTEANGNGATTQGAPQLNVIAQYTKDLSFEVPGAPMIFQEQGQPNIQLNLNQKIKTHHRASIGRVFVRECRASNHGRI